MIPCVIELNDAELRVAKAGEIVARSTGQATLVDGQIEIGNSALAVAWTHPRTSENRYWRDLNTAHIDHLGKRARHHADLAWLQLQALKAQGGDPVDVQFAVPGSMQAEQLSLLLGIAEASGLRTFGLVDSAVAAGAATLPAGSWAHVDLQQHQAVITRLDVATEVTRGVVEVLPGLGLNRLREACIRVITEAFVTHCRFDPRHHASTEQLLQTHLGHWLDVLKGQAEIKVHLEYQGRRFETRVARGAIVDATQAQLRALREALPLQAVPVASHRLAAVVGFSEVFMGVSTLGEKAVFQGMPAATKTAAALSLTTVLPATTTPIALATVQAATPAGDQATHLLDHHAAMALGTAPLYLGNRGGFSPAATPDAFASVQGGPRGMELMPLAAGRVRVNGQLVDGARAALTPGDQITLSGTSVLYTAIQVIGFDAA